MSERETRKTYVTPELVEFGSIAELTQRLGSGAEDCQSHVHIFDHGLGQGHGGGRGHNSHC